MKDPQMQTDRAAEQTAGPEDEHRRAVLARLGKAGYAAPAVTALLLSSKPAAASDLGEPQ